MTRTTVATAAMCVFGLAMPLAAQDIAVDEEDIDIGRKEYSPYLYQAHPNRVFWGTPTCTPRTRPTPA
jgi:hypothetical protein